MQSIVKAFKDGGSTATTVHHDFSVCTVQENLHSIKQPFLFYNGPSSSCVTMTRNDWVHVSISSIESTIYNHTDKTKFVGFLTLTFLMSSFCFSARARPLNMFGEVKVGFGGFVDGMSILCVKSSGQDPGGKGHKFAEVDVLGGIKKSGPSPGHGHN
ncbi:hypothetical protein QJS10_CPB13g00444 [Acorus calamus]|uniref:Uncharacterized protein n=1 Tax=Acorus calamus TaxID=4465 RepID=A0AAV9DJD8_ACOCL|nr:hypothetical protein QJS10_CPB13g00444 [Acorus calamus]